MQEMKELVEKYGTEAVVAAVKQLTRKPIPKENRPIIDDDKLQATVYQLDTAIADILEAGTALEATYQGKAELMKQARQLETEIQLEEAHAIMSITGTGKDAYATLANGTRVAITNDTARDAYRRSESQDLRKQQAATEAEITQLDISLMKARDAYNAKLEAFQGVRAKANLQASMLAYLA